jgi:hypothetical protein
MQRWLISPGICTQRYTVVDAENVEVLFICPRSPLKQQRRGACLKSRLNRSEEAKGRDVKRKR